MITVKKNIPISPYTFYNIGGVAKEVYFPATLNEVSEIYDKCSNKGMKYYVLGGGSNVLVGDEYWDGAVIISKELKDYQIFSDHIVCSAGIESSKLAEIALSHLKTGLEFLYLLPGTIGGALAVNARYDLKNISDIVNSVTAIHPKKGRMCFQVNDISFGYKHTPIISEEWFIAEISLSWEDSNYEKIKEYMEEIKIDRYRKHHYDFPSCGCVFKNDYAHNIQIGRLIDSLGLKGKRIGGAEISPYHANFIINRDNATARDVLNLIEFIESKVLEEKGIILEREVHLHGTFN